MKTGLILLSFFVIASCVSSTGVMPFGPDTYTITVGLTGAGAPGSAVDGIVGGSTRAKKAAMTESNDFCAKKGKAFYPQDVNRERNTYHLVFMCLARNDPRFTQQKWRTRPDTVIEDRR